MTSLLGGGNILHIANQLSNQLVSKSDGETANSFGGNSPNSPDSASPQYEQSIENNTEKPPLTLDMLKDSGLFSCLQPSEVANSDTASSESPEPSTQEHEEANAMAQMFHGMEESQQIALLSQLGQRMEQASREETPELSEATIRDLMPVLAAANNSCNSTSSPSAWARNAGRKKSHPVWDFFRDLKDTNGQGGVICLHCTWSGDDRSPNNLRTHLKKFHNDDGIFARFSLKLAQTPTQPYVKRVRGNGGSTSNVSTPSTPSMMMLDQKPILDSMTLALQQLQQSGSLNDYNTSLNFLDSLPKSSEVINIGGGYIKEEIDDDNENHAEAASSSSSEEPIRSETPEHSHSMSMNSAPKSPIPRNGTQNSDEQNLAAFVNNLASSNPMMLAMLNAANNSSSPPTEHSSSSPQPSNSKEGIDKKDPSSFSLSDGPCAAVLMSMALDLDMTMSYHRRRVDIELCFESNRTAEKSGGRGKVICLTDLGKEIKIVERVNGAVIDTELWTKTDFNQFHWAIRGKCQKCFNKP